MRGVIGVIKVHRASGFLHTHIIHAGITINGSQVGAAHRGVLIQQQARAIDAAVIVQLLGFFQFADGLVDAVLLLMQQGRIKETGWVVGIKATRQFQFMFGAREIADFVKRFSQIAAQHRAVRFQRGGSFQIFQCGDQGRGGTHPYQLKAEADFAQATAQPCIAQRAIQGNGLVEALDSGGRSAFGAQEKTAQGDRLRVSRRQRQAAVQGLLGFGGVAEAEFPFRDARPAEPEIRRFLNRVAGGGQRFRKLGAGLEVVRISQVE